MNDNKNYFDYFISNGEFVYTKKIKLENNQTINIQFHEYYTNKSYVYNIFLEVFSKRKKSSRNIENEISTGKFGIKPLLLAKKTILDFEDYIKERRKGRLVIYCTWTNNRRRDVYYYGLNSSGYKFKFLFNQKCLYKCIRKK